MFRRRLPSRNPKFRRDGGLDCDIASDSDSYEESTRKVPRGERGWVEVPVDRNTIAEELLQLLPELLLRRLPSRPPILLVPSSIHPFPLRNETFLRTIQQARGDQIVLQAFFEMADTGIAGSTDGSIVLRVARGGSAPSATAPHRLIVFSVNDDKNFIRLPSVSKYSLPVSGQQIVPDGAETHGPESLVPLLVDGDYEHFLGPFNGLYLPPLPLHYLMGYRERCSGLRAMREHYCRLNHALLIRSFDSPLYRCLLTVDYPCGNLPSAPDGSIITYFTGHRFYYSKSINGEFGSLECMKQPKGARYNSLVQDLLLVLLQPTKKDEVWVREAVKATTEFNVVTLSTEKEIPTYGVK